MGASQRVWRNARFVQSNQIIYAGSWNFKTSNYAWGGGGLEQVYVL